MKQLLALCVALFALLFVGGTVAGEVSCKAKPSQKKCVKQVKKKPPAKQVSPKRKIAPKEKTQVAKVAKKPLAKTSTLSQKQNAMREAFMECMSRSTADDPIGAVMEYVFSEQKKLEQTLILKYWKVHLGSTEHHGHEICLARAFGLKTFRTLDDISAEHEKLLARLDLSRIVFPKDKKGEDSVPPERQYARDWVVDYIEEVSDSFYDQFGSQMRIGSVIRDADGTQARLVRDGESMADCRYDYLCSTHTTGSTFDIGMKDVSGTERAWIKERLISDQKTKRIYFIVEGSHFHVFVLPPEFMGEE